MVSQQGIEANLDKIRAILEMAPPKNAKEVQSLSGRVVALNNSSPMQRTNACRFSGY